MCEDKVYLYTLFWAQSVYATKIKMKLVSGHLFPWEGDITKISFHNIKKNLINNGFYKFGDFCPGFVKSE